MRYSVKYEFEQWFKNYCKERGILPDGQFADDLYPAAFAAYKQGIRRGRKEARNWAAANDINEQRTRGDANG